jgi:hypothetical protein
MRRVQFDEDVRRENDAYVGRRRHGPEVRKAERVVTKRFGEDARKA